MRINSHTRYPFTDIMVNGAPAQPGVFALWLGDDLIYYGRTSGDATITSCLLDHLRGAQGRCTAAATHYTWEVCRDPLQREAELLLEYQKRFRQLPRCNGAAASLEGASGTLGWSSEAKIERGVTAEGMPPGKVQRADKGLEADE